MSEEPTKTLLPSEIVHAVRAGDLDELLDARETDQVDFKTVAYDLSNNRSKQDLIADVASFANGRGGVIVMGVRTATHATERVEVADQVVGYPKGAVDEDGYRQVIQSRVAPLIRDFRFYGAALLGDQEVGVLEVSAQQDSEKPFVVDRLVDEGDGRLTHAIGWPERSGDGTFWHPKERIQQLISTGLRSGSPPVIEPDSEAPQQELKAAWSAAGIAEATPRFVVQLVPLDSEGEFAEFFGADRAALQQWRPVRESGFGFNLRWNQPEPRGNRMVAADTNAALLLSREGLVTLASTFETRSFAWGTIPIEGRIPVNAFALTEWVAEGVRLAYDFVGPRLRPRGWQIAVIAHDLVGDRTVALWPMDVFFTDHIWLATEAESAIREERGNTWQADAYVILSEIYGRWFGQPASSIFGADQETMTIDLPAMNRFRAR